MRERPSFAKEHAMILNLLLPLLIILADLYTKYLVTANLSLYQSIPIIKGWVYITYAQNTGAAWSLFSGKVSVLALISSCVLLGLLIFFLKVRPCHWACRFGVLILMGGAAGNLIDRIRYGYVVDMVDTYLFGYNYPVFNLADSCIVIGSILFFCYALFWDKGRIFGEHQKTKLTELAGTEQADWVRQRARRTHRPQAAARGGYSRRRRAHRRADSLPSRRQSRHGCAGELCGYCVACPRGQIVLEQQSLEQSNQKSSELEG